MKRLILSTSCALLCAASLSCRGADRPNILIVTADNLGYGDLPCFNPDSPIVAPRFDRLAAEGVRLSQFYTASPTCTVSRASLLTGRIPQRHGLLDQLPGIEGNYGPGLSPDELLLPELLRDAGYVTGCFGKWNIGFAPGSRPTERGFMEFFGHASGNIDYYTHNYNGKHDLYRGVDEARVAGYAPDLFADEAIDFITRHAAGESPWFVYLPFNSPHFPNPRNKGPGEPCIWQAPPNAFIPYEFNEHTDDPRQRYFAVVTALDAALGRVLDALDELSLADDTFVFFYSDNGAFMLADRGREVASNAPLRDGGVTCWEGGIRVAAIARWPGRIDPARVVDEPLWSPDLFAAGVRIAETALPAGMVIDGRDPLPVLTDGAPSPHDSLYFSYRRHAALRQGDWKIVRTRPDEPWQLFNLAQDVGERRNLASTEPERVRALVEEFQRWDQQAAQTGRRRDL